MATFEINGKEYELKLTYASVKRLNQIIEGGTYGIIGKAISGDLDAFPLFIHAALMHTKENFTVKTVEARIEELFDNGELTFEDVMKISDEVVTQSFFLKATVDKMLARNPEMKRAIEQLRG